MTQDRIEREVVIAAPVERVWAVLTEAAHVAEWFGDAGAELDLRPGGRLEFRWRQHGTVVGVVERVEAPHRFAYRWSLRPGEEPAAGNATRVEFTLVAEREGTRLRVVESGFAGLAWSEAERERDVQANVAGWEAELRELTEYAERQAA